MRLAAISPAPFFLARRLVADAVPVGKPLLGRAVTLQLAKAPTTGFLHGNDLLALLGFWPWGDHDECFFICAAPERVLPHKHALVSAARLTLRARLHSGPGRIVALVRQGHDPGDRLARIAGFSRRSPASASGGFTVWKMCAPRAVERSGAQSGASGASSIEWAAS